MSNIKNNINRGIGIKLSQREYFDFNLTKDTHKSICLSDSSYTNYDHPCLISWFDFNDENVFGDDILKQFISLREWPKSKFPTEPIPNYGLTGMDNGYVGFTPNLTCSDDEVNPFFKTLTETNLEFPFQNKFYLTRVETDDPSINLEITLEEEYNVGKVLKLNGGFLQGFYKLDGYDYQTLPKRFLKGFSMGIWLKKSAENLEVDNNSGFFLYFGTRAENKYWLGYSGQNKICQDENVSQFTTFRENTYTIEYADGVIGNLNDKIIPKRIVDNQFLIYGQSSFSHDGLGTYNAFDFKCSDDVSVKVDAMSEPLKLGDNPFLLYGRGNGKICQETVISEPQYTACDILPTIPSIPPSSLNDVVDNALGFRITPEGAIQYRMVTQNEDCEIVIREETSKNGIIKPDQWHNVIIRWVPDKYLEGDECETQETTRMGKLMFYVDCLLKHTIKNFPEFMARRLDTEKEKQVSVPFTISLGGGTFGLRYNKTFDGPDPNDLGLVLEQQFNGSFIGMISQFKIYDCDLSWCEIKEICKTESDRYNVEIPDDLNFENIIE